MGGHEQNPTTGRLGGDEILPTGPRVDEGTDVGAGFEPPQIDQFSRELCKVRAGESAGVRVGSVGQRSQILHHDLLALRAETLIDPG